MADLLRQDAAAMLPLGEHHARVQPEGDRPDITEERTGVRLGEGVEVDRAVAPAVARRDPPVEGRRLRRASGEEFVDHVVPEPSDTTSVLHGAGR